VRDTRPGQTRKKTKDLSACDREEREGGEGGPGGVCIAMYVADDIVKVQKVFLSNFCCLLSSVKTPDPQAKGL
jgi:hypothetical protein